MTEYGVLKRGRRRDGFVALTFGVLLVFAGLSLRIGPVWAALCALALPALVGMGSALTGRSCSGVSSSTATSCAGNLATPTAGAVFHPSSGTAGRLVQAA